MSAEGISDRARRLQIEVPRVEYEKLASDRAGESSEAVRQRVNVARERQQGRFDGTGLTCNADTPALQQAQRGASVTPAHIREFCELDDTSKALMRSAMNQLGMSARAFHRVLQLARTIADLAGAEQIQAAHLAKAIHLRSTTTTGMRNKLCVNCGTTWGRRRRAC